MHEAVFERPPEETVTIHLPAGDVEVVKRMAQAKGVGYAVLIREWVIENCIASEIRERFNFDN